jgi:hypothetical protein
MDNVFSIGQRVQDKRTELYGTVVETVTLKGSDKAVVVEYPDYPRIEGTYWHRPNDLDAVN